MATPKITRYDIVSRTFNAIMPMKKQIELEIGDVVEFTHNGAHEKTVGVVVKDMHGGNCIQCADYVTGIGDRKYKVLYNIFEKQNTNANIQL